MIRFRRSCELIIVLSVSAWALDLTPRIPAQSAPVYFPMPLVTQQQFLESGGLPLAGGKIYAYAAGTLTPLTTYSDAIGTPNTHPVILDSTGRASIYLSSAAYKIVAQNSLGVLQWTIDNVSNIGRFSTPAVQDNVRHCSQFSAATADAKLAACIADIPHTGGIADARGLEGAQTWSSCPFTGVTSPVTILVGAATHTLAVNCTVPANITLDLAHGGVVAVPAGITLTLNGGFTGTLSQHFAGAGTVSMASTRIPEVYPEWWGADASDLASDAAAIQSAINAACVNGSKVFKFATGTTVPSGSRYILGASTINVPCGEVKITGPKFTRISKTGSGDFFLLAVNGYGFEAENLWLSGDESRNQVGFNFRGFNIGPYMQGPLHARIHNSWFEAVGDKDAADETAGGAVLISSQALGFAFDNNIIASSGYTVRITTGNDGTKISHNVSLVSKSMCYQFINTIGAAAYEVSNNNCASVGGFMYVQNGGYMNVFGNSYIPGEVGTLGNMVKRDYASTSLAENPAGVSAAFVFRSSQNPKIQNNLCSMAVAATGDYCMWFGNGQSPGTVAFNVSAGPGIAGIRNSPQHMAYIQNSVIGSGDLYSDPIHPGILHFAWDGRNENYWSFGTGTPTAPFEIAVPAAALPPTDGASQFKISNKLDPTEWIGMGWNDTSTTGYLQCYKSGMGYTTCQQRSPTLFLGASGDTAVTVQNGPAQKSKPFRLLNSAGVELFSINPEGMVTIATGSDSNLASISSGAGVPGPNCTAGRQLYYDTSANEYYGCGPINTWKKLTN